MKLRSVSIMLCMVFMAVTVFAKTSTDWDKTVDFSKYKTYSWVKVKAPNEIWDKRVMDTIDAQLQAKGWTKAETGGSVGIVAIATTEDQQSLDTFYNGFGGGWGYRGWGGAGMGTATTTVNNYRVGTLVVDMYDASNKQLIWRGYAEDTLSDKPEKNEKKLNDRVKDIFKKFPPTPSTK